MSTRQKRPFDVDGWIAAWRKVGGFSCLGTEVWMMCPLDGNQAEQQRLESQLNHDPRRRVAVRERVLEKFFAAPG